MTIFRDARGGQYQHTETRGLGEIVRPEAFADVTVEVDALFSKSS